MRPVLALLRAERVMVAVLGLVVLVTAFLAASVPAALTARYDGALREHLKGAPVDLEVRTTASGRRPTRALGDEESLQTVGRDWYTLVPGRLAELTGPPEHEVTTPRLGIEPVAGRARPAAALVLSWNPGLESKVRYVSGTAPHDPPAGAPFEIGMAARAAERLGLRAGDTVTIRPDGPALLRARISGLYAPIAAGDPFWAARDTWLDAPLMPIGQDTEINLSTVALDAAGFARLYARTDLGLNYLWRFPVASGRLSAADAGPVMSDLTEFEYQVQNRQVPGSSFQPASRLGSLLPEFSRQLRVTEAVLYLGLGGLGAAALGVLLLTCLVFLQRVNGGLATMRARGASLFQLGRFAAVAMATAVVPAAAAGYGAALLLTGEGSLAGASVVGIAATLVPALTVTRSHRRPGRAERRDLTATRPAPRRVVAECLVLVLAVVGVLVLRRRGLAGDVPEHGTDPFLAAVPVLIATAAGLVTLRFVPYPLRSLGLAVRRTRSAVPFIGITRASRQRPVTAVPLVIMLLATAMAGFGATVDAGLRSAQEASARHTVGADARVYATSLNEADVRRIQRVDGVSGTVEARFIDGVTLTGEGLYGRDVTVIAVDLAAYRRLAGRSAAGVPAPPRQGAGPVALISPALARAARAARARPLTVSWNGGPTLGYRQGGTIEEFATMPREAEFVVVPYTSLGSAANTFATTVFVRGRNLDRTALARAASEHPGPASGVSADTFAEVHAELADRPLVALVHAAFGYGWWASAGCGGLAILLMLTMEAESRGRTVSYLRTLGLSGAQLRRLTLVELAPVIVCAVVAGWALGVLLPVIVGSAIDLRPYTGGWDASYRLLDPLATVILAGGTLVVGGAAIAIDAAVNARRRLGGLLRMGEET